MTQSTVRKAIITAAGLGTRFLPVTKAQPKEMLPLLDKPTIQYGVEEAKNSGLEEVVMVIGGGKRAIVDHFDRSREIENYLLERGKDDLLAVLAEVNALTDQVQVVYVQQKEPLGLGHAVGCARRLVEDEPCAVLLPDDVILGAEPCLSQLIRAHAETGATVLATRRVPRDQINRYGILATGGSEGRLHEVVDLVEKPDPSEAPSDLAIFGRYVLMPDVLTAIADTGGP
jgi:UTP--glucose-1-phosphate uridylyltransferase